MKADNKEAGSDMKFLFWDDPGDSQENVDNQKASCSNHARLPRKELDWAEEEEKLNECMRRSSRRTATLVEHYPEYQDYYRRHRRRINNDTNQRNRKATGRDGVQRLLPMDRNQYATTIGSRQEAYSKKTWW
jgi:hypothetical protein